MRTGVSLRQRCVVGVMGARFRDDHSVAASQAVAGKLSDLTTKSADLPTKPNQIKPVQAVRRCRTLPFRHTTC
jgi:hypothetical protein